MLSDGRREKIATFLGKLIVIDQTWRMNKRIANPKTISISLDF